MAADALAVARPYQPTAVKRQGGIPQFLDKLYHMVEDPNTDLIKWSDSGDSFVVTDQERFSKEILGRWFKHQNFGSFVRQLNLYGFRKVPHLQQGALHSDTSQEPLCFENVNFHRGQPDLLHLISRKKQAAPGRDGGDDKATPATTATTNSPARSLTAANGALDVSGLLTGIAAIKRHQTQISTELTELKRSNQALWQEAYSARERYQRQQDTIDRILKFLAGVFGSAPASGSQNKDQTSKTPDAPGVRRMPKRLMIESAGDKGKASEPGASRFVEHTSPTGTDEDMDGFGASPLPHGRRASDPIVEFATPPPDGQPHASISAVTSPSLSTPFAAESLQGKDVQSQPFFNLQNLQDMLPADTSGIANDPGSFVTQPAASSSSFDPTMSSLISTKSGGMPDAMFNNDVLASLMKSPNEFQRLMSAMHTITSPAASPVQTQLNGGDLLLSHNGQSLPSPPSFSLDGGPMASLWPPTDSSSMAILNAPNSDIVCSSADPLVQPLAHDELRVQKLADSHGNLDAHIEAMDTTLHSLLENLGLPPGVLGGDNANVSLDQLGLNGHNFGSADPLNLDILNTGTGGAFAAPGDDWHTFMGHFDEHATVPEEADFNDFNDDIASPSPKPPVVSLPVEAPKVPSKRKPEVAEIDGESPKAKRSARKKR
ncbi:hypothetical protein AURDEDRAFT_157884 [Auricularia subglabra TFB-10046 SS5]|nr:hypothetical protein AURDEDRAFT_157884 [Auricularia subglabra TFB-10046 SS5]